MSKKRVDNRISDDETIMKEIRLAKSIVGRENLVGRLILVGGNEIEPVAPEG